MDVKLIVSDGRILVVFQKKAVTRVFMPTRQKVTMFYTIFLDTCSHVA
jgi:hypothetical protein